MSFTQRKKTKRKEREYATRAVLAREGEGEMQKASLIHLLRASPL
jgi:hypothetical protein